MVGSIAYFLLLVFPFVVVFPSLILPQRSRPVHGLHHPEHPVHAHREPRQRDRGGADGEQNQWQCLLQNRREQLQDVCCLLCFSPTLCQCK